ncbi:MAG: hypothetical protein P1U85_07095 [Verrucomicrobiales bacterium]|jgi:hypothetical protein|nr:hypothetical protein [Verrucomicrobiales bacterium]
MPKTISWFLIYGKLLCGFYALLVVAGIYFVILPHGSLGADPYLARIIGAVAIILGALYFGATYISLHMPRRPGAWNYNFAIILLGFTSVVFLPFGVFLMIRWQRPEIREYYGVNPS